LTIFFSDGSAAAEPAEGSGVPAVLLQRGHLLQAEKVDQPPPEDTFLCKIVKGFLERNNSWRPFK